MYSFVILKRITLILHFDPLDRRYYDRLDRDSEILLLLYLRHYFNGLTLVGFNKKYECL